MTSQFKLLAADKFQAQCQEPTEKESNIILKRDATCIIQTETNVEELGLVRKRFSAFVVNETSRLYDYKLLYCFCCKCDIKKIHDKHVGTHTVKPFGISRIEISPALCFKHISGSIEPYAEIRGLVKRR